MKNYKVVFAIIAIFILAFCLVACNNSEESDKSQSQSQLQSQSQFEYTLNSDGESWTLSNCTAVGVTDIVIPSTHPDGKPITIIGVDAFEGCSGLTSITFKDTTTWYRANCETEVDLTDASQNATYFTDSYYNYYLYKM